MVAQDSDKVKVRVCSLRDYRKDPENANRGSERGQRMITDSFKELGPGRSLLADSADTLIAGNHAIDGALAAGIERAIEVEVPADAVVVVKRTDLTLGADLMARRMAIADNRANDVNLDFDVDRLLADPAAVEGFFRQDELDDLLAGAEIAQEVTEKLGEGVSAERLTGDPKKQIKPVLYVDEVAIFEQAIRATGLVNRGQAVLAICRAYLEQPAHG